MCRIIKLFLAIALLATPVLADTFGEWTYSVANGEATITGYSGSGGAVVIPSEVNGIPVRQVGNDHPPVFGYNNTNITSITIPNSVTSIGDIAFYLCRGLTNVTIPNSVTSIGLYAFSHTSLTNITIPNSVTFIGDFAFFNSTNLTSITIPNSVTSIGMQTFNYCTSLTSITIPNGVTSIGPSAFGYCTSLTNITIPNGVRSIGGWAFSNNTNLTSLTIPNSVTNIGEYAFNYCTGLTNIILPPRFMLDTLSFGIKGKLAADNLVLSLANTLATNTTFINNLAQAIISASNNYGLATQSAITTATSNLATQSQITTAINEGKASGIASVTASPNTWSLFTASQIQNMAIGDLVLTRTNNGSFVLNYDIEQSEDLQNWTPYQGFAMALTNLPTNKAFVRIKAKQ